MELTGKLKETVENCKSREQVKEEIEKAGMILNEKELDSVAGGITVPPVPLVERIVYL